MWSMESMEIQLPCRAQSAKRCQCCFRLARSVLESACRAAARAITTKSQGGNTVARRNESRVTRLMRFLATALDAVFRDTASPRRESLVGPALPRTVKYRSAERWGFRKTRAKSSARVSRRSRWKNARGAALLAVVVPASLRGSIAHGPWHVGAAKSGVLLWLPYAPGIRGYACASS